MRAQRGRYAIAQILVGSVLGQGIVIGISPLLTRMYTPGDFGALAIITAMSAVGGRFATLSWEAAITLPRKNTEATALVWLALVSAIFISAFAATALFFLRAPLAEAFDTEVFSQLWWVAPATIFAIAFFKVMTIWLVRGQKYSAIAWRNASQGIGQAGFNLGVGIISPGALGLVGGVGFGRLVATLLIAPKSFSAILQRPSISTVRSVANRYRKFPLMTSWSSTFNTLGLQLPILILTFAFGAFEVGFLALTMRVLATPVGVVSDAVSQQFEGVFATKIRSRSDSRHLLQQFDTTTGWLFVISIIPVVLIAIMSPWLFGLIFGSGWDTSGEYAQILIIVYMAQFVVAPVSRSLLLLERQKTQMLWDIGRMVLVAGAVAVCALAGADLITAVVTLSISQFLSYIALYSLSRIAVRSHQFGVNT